MNHTEFVYVTYIATTPKKLWQALTSSEYTEKYFLEAALIQIGKREQKLPILGTGKLRIMDKS